MKDVMKSLKAALLGSAATEVDVAKRAGLLVKRPVLNSADWYDWAVKYEIPNPVPAEKMHVTLIYSPGKDAKIKPQDRPMIMLTEQGGFHMFGVDEDCLVLALGGYEVWELHDRHYFLQTAGLESKWPSYRPHMTLSYDAKDFEISDEALAAAPDYVILGTEVFDDIDDNFAEAAKSMNNPEGLPADDLKLVPVDAALREAAKTLLDVQKSSLDPIETATLWEIAKADSVPIGIIRQVGIDADSHQVEIRKTLELEFKLVTEEVAKSLGLQEAFKSNEAEQMVVVIASVAKSGGELSTDLHGDQMDGQALVEFSRDIIRGTRAGQFNHNGDNRFEIVQSLFLGEDIQKSLGIDLGYEPLLMEIHIPDSKDWAEVNDGEWGVSIRGTMYVEGPAE